ncbi:serine threonine-protein kinase [Musa troglodytarum]|uniref:Serine threonine-protein kinase n=1 Tax=Musa troglodytarum TaxID=320322 RepID=A0A9E7EXE1_9LILI|nr:serine threonine-protein kinase [Musa troglodytarum]
MSCFPCFGPRRREASGRINDSGGSRSASTFVVDSSGSGKKVASGDCERSTSARKFTFRDLAIATQNFKETNLIGEGGFERVFKGRLDSGQASYLRGVVAIKQLKHDGPQGSKEFLVEGDERLLVYEYMPKGSLEDHLFGSDTGLCWLVEDTDSPLLSTGAMHQMTFGPFTCCGLD